MKTYKIKFSEELHKFKQDNGYHIKGNLEVDCSLDFSCSLIVDGYLYIEAGVSIEAGESIKAGGYIEAGGYVFSFYFEIDCKTLITRTLPFYREYWAGLSILKKWRKQILNRENCWGELRKLISKEEAKQICQWDGFHWILKRQLEMFLGLKTKHVLTKKEREG